MARGVMCRLAGPWSVLPARVMERGGAVRVGAMWRRRVGSVARLPVRAVRIAAVGDGVVAVHAGVAAADGCRGGARDDVQAGGALEYALRGAAL